MIFVTVEVVVAAESAVAKARNPPLEEAFINLTVPIQVQVRQVVRAGVVVPVLVVVVALSIP